MGNVLEKAKQEQVIALGRLGWSLRRIEAATGVRRETAGGYLRSAGIALRMPGGWGRKPPAKAATSVTAGSNSSKPADEVITGFFGSAPAENSKPANEVITGFLPEVALPEQGGSCPRCASSSLMLLEPVPALPRIGDWEAPGGGAHFADQVNNEVASRLKEIYTVAYQPKDLHFYFVPMPNMLRKSGSFGTHWMLQDYIKVEFEYKKETKTATGTKTETKKET